MVRVAAGRCPGWNRRTRRAENASQASCFFTFAISVCFAWWFARTASQKRRSWHWRSALTRNANSLLPCVPARRIAFASGNYSAIGGRMDRERVDACPESCISSCWSSPARRCDCTHQSFSRQGKEHRQGQGIKACKTLGVSQFAGLQYAANAPDQFSPWLRFSGLHFHHLHIV